MLRGACGFACLSLLLAMGCGSSKKPEVATPGGSEPEASDDDCEPGRCMPDISGRIDDHRPAARACYDEGYQRDPTLAGSLIINFEIDPSGKVVDASQSTRDDQIMDAGVVDCVSGVIRDITFAKSERGKTTRAFHRYEFSPP